MATSSLFGADRAPSQPGGRGSDLLGPSDNSDSGSDTIGTDEAHADSDAAGTGERGAVAGADAREGGDILPDRVLALDDEGNGLPEADPDGQEFTDIESDDLGQDTGDDAQDQARDAA